MAKYELNIYGENDEIVKQYSTNICSWGVFIQAAEMSETLQEKSALEQLSAVGDILKCVFRGITTEELMCADASDVMNTFSQIVAGGQKIKGANSKNA